MSGLYTPEQMLEAMRTRQRPETFLRDRLINMPAKISDTKYIEIDEEIIANGIAGYNSRTGEAVEVAKDGMTSYLHVAPYVNEQVTMTPADVDTRLPGQTIYEGTAEDRESTRVNQNMDKLQDRLDNLEESQAAEIIQTGKVTVSAVGDSYTVDYSLPAANKVTLSGVNVWGGASSAIRDNLITWSKVPRQNGYPVVDIYMDDLAGNLFLDDVQSTDGSLHKLFDMKNVEAGNIDIDAMSEMSATYLGMLKLPGLTARAWIYSGGYRTNATTYVQHMNNYRVVMVGRGFGLQPCYGKIENFKAGFVGRRFPNMWGTDNGKFRYMSMESSPLMVGRNIRAIFSATVVS